MFVYPWIVDKCYVDSATVLRPYYGPIERKKVNVYMLSGKISFWLALRISIDFTKPYRVILLSDWNNPYLQPPWHFGLLLIFRLRNVSQSSMRKWDQNQKPRFLLQPLSGRLDAH